MEHIQNTAMTRKNIYLPKGGILEVDITPKFLDILCSHYNLSSQLLVDDDHIRMYVWGAFKNALDKAKNTTSTENL